MNESLREWIIRIAFIAICALAIGTVFGDEIGQVAALLLK